MLRAAAGSPVSRAEWKATGDRIFFRPGVNRTADDGLLQRARIIRYLCSLAALDGSTVVVLITARKWLRGMLSSSESFNMRQVSHL